MFTVCTFDQCQFHLEGLCSALDVPSDNSHATTTVCVHWYDLYIIKTKARARDISRMKERKIKS